MPEDRYPDRYPVRYDGQLAVVALPEHIDVSNAGHIREELLSVINRGAAVLIADMTATVSCDQAGADTVTRAYQRAVASGSELRLVVTAQVVSRVLSLSGLDRLVSLYPSLEAAMAAGVPAAASTPARGAGINGQSHSRARQPGPRVLRAGLPDGTGAGVTPAVARALLEALPDGVMLADGDGTIALASRRLAEMFGYEHAELAGRPAESLIPAGLGEARRGQQAGYAQAPRNYQAGAGMLLAGLRKDGTRFPAEVSLSPVIAADARFTLAVIREVTDGQRPGGSAPAAVPQASRPRELLDTIITSLFRVGFSLQAAMDLPAEMAGQRIAEALGHLDETIREIRDTAFTAPDRETRALTGFLASDAVPPRQREAG